MQNPIVKEPIDDGEVDIPAEADSVELHQLILSVQGRINRNRASIAKIENQLSRRPDETEWAGRAQCALRHRNVTAANLADAMQILKARLASAEANEANEDRAFVTAAERILAPDVLRRVWSEVDRALAA